ncbi:unnamed protein product, partial [Ectocarpus fasciculatus]
AALGQAGGRGADDSASAGEALLLPSARPVSNPVAIPCTSSSIRTARRLTAVTATPAHADNVVFGVPMSCCAETGGGANNDTAGAPATAGQGAGAPTVVAATDC